MVFVYVLQFVAGLVGLQCQSAVEMSNGGMRVHQSINETRRYTHICSSYGPEETMMNLMAYSVISHHSSAAVIADKPIQEMHPDRTHLHNHQQLHLPTLP